MSLQKLTVSALLILMGVFFFYFTDIDLRPRNAERKKAQARNLESYRSEFPQADGSLPSDEALRNILRAKGIPFTEKQNADSTSADPRRATMTASLPTIEFLLPRTDFGEEEKIREGVSAHLPGILEMLQRAAPGLAIQRLTVDNARKIGIYFTKEFQEIASDEGRLTQFSESLAILESAGLKGQAIFIEGEPLGVYMQELDKKRDEEAAKNSPRTSEGKTVR